MTAPAPAPASIAHLAGTLEQVRETPLTIVHRAVRADGELIAVHLVRAERLALATDAERVRDALRRLAHATPAAGAALPPVLWAERDDDGRLWFAVPWSETVPIEHAASGTEESEHSARELAAPMAALCRALHAMHDLHVVHGTIAPDVVRRRTADGAIVLDDAAVAHALVAGGAAPAAVLSGLAALPYASPEARMATDGSARGAVDHRSDVYALGATLYELLTGAPPFGGRTTATIMATVLVSRTEELTSATATHVVNGVIDALLRAIEKAPDDRWPSAAVFAAALEAALAQRSGSGTITAGGIPAGTPAGTGAAITAARSRRPSPALLAAMALLAVLLGGVLMLLLARTR